MYICNSSLNYEPESKFWLKFQLLALV